MRIQKTNLLSLALVVFACFVTVSCHKEVQSFKQLAQYHCSKFPIQTLWRVATGTVSEKFGEQFYDFDCYIRTFVRRDGITMESKIINEDQQQEEEQQQQEDEQLNRQLVFDPIVQEYAQGLAGCLPEGIDSVQATYAMWRFFRYLVQHDYAYQWMRARIRATLGYQAQRPNAWMDGLNSAERLRLDKLFSNQFYDYLDNLMFKDFLYPLLTFFKENVVVALSGKVTSSGNPMLFQSLQTHNHLAQVFYPVVLTVNNKRIFTYTIPGFPLLIAGSTSDFAWSFTGVLVDRTNIEQIQTVGNKYYNHDLQEWLKLDTQQIPIPGVKDKVCKFMHSVYGPLYYKRDDAGKNQEYIVKWHQKQRKVRMLFSDILKLVQSQGQYLIETEEKLQFPFNSIVYINDKGFHQYICQQFYPSYFLYPDMFGEPQKLKQRLFTYPNKKILVVSNTKLTSSKQQQYSKNQFLSPRDQQIVSSFKAAKQNKYTLQSFLQFVQSITTTSFVKKQRQSFTRIYRKIKFLYLLNDQDRKKCDQAISALEKWDNNLSDKKLAPIYILWEYFVRQYTFNYVSVSKYASAIIKHKLVSDNYWTNQLALWQKGTSYGQCESNQYQQFKDEVNGTGHNSSCYLNIIRAINETAYILSQKYNNDYSKINLDDFTQKRHFENNENNYIGNHIQQAFGAYYSKNIMFVSELKNPNIIYYQGYLEQRKELNLQQNQSGTPRKQQQKAQRGEEL